MTNKIKQEALEYHSQPIPGKLSISISKPTETQNDLALAYSPGVAEPSREIALNPEMVYTYTAKQNLVGVISDGSAVLGLGNIGPLAAKPVMEGKAVLFKKLADIDVFDLELQTDGVQDFIQTVKSVAPTFGGINLEDIKAPQCFEIEEALKECLDIPVFHDDQHGTAVTVAAGLLNALELQGKNIEDVKIVCLGAGAAGIASMKLLNTLGAKKENICMVDSKGVISTSRTNLNNYKYAFAIDTEHKTLDDAIAGADVFVGVSGANLLSRENLIKMANNPIVFALANPDPEIMPETAIAVRDDVIIATGRSDYPNQVNNVLCFPYLFRAALDVRAKEINQEMLVAAVHAIAHLAKEEICNDVVKMYPGSEELSFGKNYILPKPMDSRLKYRVAMAVAKAAIETKVASMPLPEYYERSQN